MVKLDATTCVPSARSQFFLDNVSRDGTNFLSLPVIAEQQLKIAERLIGENEASYLGAMKSEDIKATIRHLTEDVETYRQTIERLNEMNVSRYQQSCEERKKKMAQSCHHGIVTEPLMLPDHASEQDFTNAIDKFESCVNALERTISAFQAMQSQWGQSCRIL